MKKYFLAAVLLLSLINPGLLCGSAEAAEAPAAVVVVTIEGSSFSPEVAVIKAGGEVVWKNKDAAVHTVTANDGSFDSGSLSQGDEYRRKFPSAGVFKYSCDNHAWMGARIEVR